MVKYWTARPDASFAALSGAIRRGVLERAKLVTMEKVDGRKSE